MICRVCHREGNRLFIPDTCIDNRQTGAHKNTLDPRREKTKMYTHTHTHTHTRTHTHTHILSRQIIKHADESTQNGRTYIQRGNLVNAKRHIRSSR